MKMYRKDSKIDLFPVNHTKEIKNVVTMVIELIENQLGLFDFIVTLRLRTHQDITKKSQIVQKV